MNFKEYIKIAKRRRGRFLEEKKKSNMGNFFAKIFKRVFEIVIVVIF